MNKINRFWEVDFLRGIAILMMIIFHIIYDLSIFGDFNFNISSGFWFYFGKICTIIFLLLVGISLSITFSSKKRDYNYYFKRGLKIFFYGFIITIITWFFIKEEYVKFGILHLIGISIIIIYPFLKLNKWLNILLGSIFVYLGLFLYNVYFNFSYLLFLGFRYHGFSSIDYYPILPWFGIILIGLFLGNSLYSNKKRKFKIIDLSNNIFIKYLSYLGKHSLLIYLIHQPIILLLLKITGII